MLFQVIKEMRRRKRVDFFTSRVLSRHFPDAESITSGLTTSIQSCAEHILDVVPPELVDDVTSEVNKQLQIMVMDANLTQKRKAKIVQKLSENVV